MRVCVLGSIEVTVEGRRVDVTGKEEVLLVSLALAAGRAVPAESLAERLWEGEVGDSWRSTLYTYVTRLRRRLEAAGVPRSCVGQRRGGYALDIAAEDVDWTAFAARRSQASTALRGGDAASSLALLEDALGLWHGEPLPGLAGRWASEMRVTMAHAHQAALDSWARLAWRQGRVEDSVDVLTDAVGRYPHNEALTAHLMRALDRAGRSADALAAYRQIRARLVEETGAEPNPELARTHQQILRQQGGASASSAVSSVALDSATVRSNVPRDLADFADRHTEVSRMRNVLSPSPDCHATRVCVVSGMPGVGKTSLAVRVAHLAGAEFEDGCVMVELRGHHEHQAPQSATEALGELLQLVGVPAAAMGESLHQRIAVWRDHIARRKVLVILDDAVGTEQVLPLLPSGPNCAVIITSRQRLPEIEGACHLRLGELTPADAVTVFNAIADQREPQGQERGHDGEEVAQLVELCGHLPLAMRLMATRLGEGRDRDYVAVVERLRAVSDTLDEFRAGQRRLVAAFTVSLHSLSSRAREAFLRLGLHPCSTLDQHVGAAMIGLDPAEADRVFEELVGASLVEFGAEPGTYRLHSLIMNFAHRTACATLSAIERHSVVTRMLHSYLSTCARADRILYPHRLRQPAPFEIPDLVGGPELVDSDAAMRWLTTQLSTVIAVIDHAARGGYTIEAAFLTHLVANHIDAHGPWEVSVELHRRALEIWRARGDARATAQSSYELARGLLHAGSVSEAEDLIAWVVDLWRDIGDEVGQAWALDQHGVTAYVAGDYGQGAQLHQQAQELFERAGHRPGIALSLDRRGTCHLRSAEFHAAISAHNDALRLQDLLGDTSATINTKIHLAGAFQGLGYHREAAALSHEALVGVRELRDRRREGIVTSNLGEVYAYRHDYEQAFAYFQTALDIQRDIHDPWNEATTLSNLGRLHLKVEQFDHAQHCLQESQHICMTYVNPGIRVESRLGLGEVELRRGDLEAAHDHVKRALDDAERSRLPHERAQALTTLGRILRMKGALDSAQAQLEAAEQQYTALDSPDASYVRIMIDTLHEAQN